MGVWGCDEVKKAKSKRQKAKGKNEEKSCDAVGRVKEFKVGLNVLSTKGA